MNLKLENMIHLLKKINWLRTILIVSIILRMVVALFMGDVVTNLPGTNDQISYHTLALRVISGNGFTFGENWWPMTQARAPTAHWSFLYTFYLVVVYSIFGPHPIAARLIQALIVGFLQPYLAFKLGNHLFTKKLGLISAGLTAVYAYFIYYSAALMTEPFFIVMVLTSLYLTVWIAKAYNERSSNRKMLFLSVLLGFVLGCTVLLRQLYLLLIPFHFLWIFWAARKKTIRSSLAGILMSGGIIIIMILPFTLYNTNRFGHFVLLNTNSGYAFFWANHPVYGTHFQAILPEGMGTYQSLIPEKLWNLDEAALDQALLKQGIQFVVEDPLRYILLSISRIPVYFMFWPSPDSELISNISRVISFGLLWPFMLYGLFRSIKDQRLGFYDRMASPAFLFVLIAVIYTLIHLLSWALIRYRLPVDAVMLVFAGYGVIDLVQRLFFRQKNPNRAVI
jgi:hypothetical protein